MNKEIIKYAKLKAKADALAAEMAGVKDEIMANMEKAGTTKLDTKVGKFTIGSRTNWSYTDTVKKLKEKVKVAEIKEQKSGVAEANVTHYLVFTQSKE